MRPLKLHYAAFAALALSACQTTVPTVHVNPDAANLAAAPATAGTTVDVAAPVIPVLAEIAVDARGTASGELFPELHLLLDGEQIGTVRVNDTMTRYVFLAPVPAPAASHKVEVRFPNDRGPENGAGDRNLIVNGITVNGTAIGSDDPTVQYRRPKGKDVVVTDGRRNLWWEGSLVFPVSSDMLVPPAAGG